ncbi:hypothetical protein RvY_14697 [Ramazzottius varieornatus]|uniref:Uncharacterized protein n=1 Tax=Ramazzottius varieornatus TaxID=947166 RepID=A0A1D1VX99_RAMVA|nr:hypothetical protein RvY_14697 [Ramazzottius varieornatus]
MSKLAHASGAGTSGPSSPPGPPAPQQTSAPKASSNRNTRGAGDHGRMAHDKPGPSEHKLPKLEYDPSEYQLVKHLPRQCPRGPGEVYITLKTSFKAQLERCKKLLEAPGCKSISLHGMGAATNRAVNLALTLQAEYAGLLEISTTTGSTEITNELEPLRDDLDPISQSRFISVINLKLFFVKSLEDLKKPKENANKQ